MEKIFKESIIAEILDAIPEFARKYLRIFYLIILCLYVGCYQMDNIIWTDAAIMPEYTIFYFMKNTILWLSVLYISVVLVMWRQKWYTVLPALALVMYIIFYGPDLYFDVMRKVVAVFLAVAAYGVDYKKILKCYMWVVFGFLVFALVGIPMGITVNRGLKMGNEYGNAYGYIYANNWTHAVLQVMFIFWYLYLQKKHVVTFLLFWLSIIPFHFGANCNTSAAMSIIFPFIALMIDLFNRKEKTGKLRTAWNWLMIATPFLCLALILICAVFTEWFYPLMKLKEVGTIAYRFVANGVAIRHYGLHLLGHIVSTSGDVVGMVDGHAFKLTVMDSAIATYLLQYGAIWMFAVLAWLTAANRKCVREKDRALLFLSNFMVMFAIIERNGLKGPYNFVLMYPLATVGAMKVKEKLTSTTEASGSPENADVADVVPIPDSIKSDQSSHNSIL